MTTMTTALPKSTCTVPIDYGFMWELYTRTPLELRHIFIGVCRGFYKIATEIASQYMYFTDAIEAGCTGSISIKGKGQARNSLRHYKYIAAVSPSIKAIKVAFADHSVKQRMINHPACYYSLRGYQWVVDAQIAAPHTKINQSIMIARGDKKAIAELAKFPCCEKIAIAYANGQYKTLNRLSVRNIDGYTAEAISAIAHLMPEADVRDAILQVIGSNDVQVHQKVNCLANVARKISNEANIRLCLQYLTSPVVAVNYRICRQDCLSRFTHDIMEELNMPWFNIERVGVSELLGSVYMAKDCKLWKRALKMVQVVCPDHPVRVLVPDKLLAEVSKFLGKNSLKLTPGRCADSYRIVPL